MYVSNCNLHCLFQWKNVYTISGGGDISRYPSGFQATPLRLKVDISKSRDLEKSTVLLDQQVGCGEVTWLTHSHTLLPLKSEECRVMTAVRYPLTETCLGNDGSLDYLSSNIYIYPLWKSEIPNQLNPTLTDPFLSSVALPVDMWKSKLLL